jgi:type IV secretion system protein VirB9
MKKPLFVLCALALISCATPPPPVEIPEEPNPSNPEVQREGEAQWDLGTASPESPFVPQLSVDLPEYYLPEEAIRNQPAPEGTVLVTSQNSTLEIRPKKEYYRGGAVVYPYLDNHVYQIFTALEQLTNIQLEPGEELVAPPASGNTDVFAVQFSYAQENGRPRANIYIMPYMAGKNTTLFINTNKRTYSFMVYSYNTTFMPLVSFNYPQQLQEAIRQRIENSNNDIAISGSLTNLDFNYVIIPHSPNKPRWMPTLVFNDGSKTYIYFPSAGRASYAPVLFEVNSKNERVIVNYRVKGTYYIVDRVLSQAELVLDVNEGNIITIKRN